MSNIKHCPHCHCSTKVVKIGTTSAGRQRYKCRDCSRTWTSKARPQRLQANIWHDYAIEKLTINQLCKKYNCGKDKIREVLNSYKVSNIIPSGTHDVIGMDCTYFGKRANGTEWGLLVVVDLHTKETLYCEELPGHETWAHYIQAVKALNQHDIYPKACVIDGVPGLAKMLVNRGILVQYCQFHQVKTIATYLTRNPILEPNKALRDIALSLAHVDSKTFVAMFTTWCRKNEIWLNSKTRSLDTGKLEYAHKKTRSAVHSIQRNLLYLYTYEQHPELHIPNTNNTLEGINNALKSQLSNHRGVKKELKTKLIRTFLSSKTEM